LIFSTKYRRGVLTDRVREFLDPVTAKICTDFEATLEAVDGEDDHVHPLVCHPPKVALSTLINSLKGVVARDPKREIPGGHPPPVGRTFWSPSYCVVSCAGPRLRTSRNMSSSSGRQIGTEEPGKQDA